METNKFSIAASVKQNHSLPLGQHHHYQPMLNIGECSQLEEIRQKACDNGVDDLTLIGKKQLRSLEPAAKAEAAIFSPSTGIIETHSLMRSFYMTAHNHGALITFHSEVRAILQEPQGYQLEINHGEYRLRTLILINSAGLYADRIAQMADMDIDKAEYRLKHCKGNYYMVFGVVLPMPHGAVSLGRSCLPMLPAPTQAHSVSVDSSRIGQNFRKTGTSARPYPR
jgi:L-2-hydroxyglutarate oxidase LhgO